MVVEIQEYKECRVLKRLFWYLNAGGRRNWNIIEQPDKINRNRPSPDFICEEERTKARLAVEITTVSPLKDGNRIEAQTQQLNQAAKKIGELVEKKIGPLSGIYVSEIHICFKPTEEKLIHDAADKFVKEYKTGRLSTFSEIQRRSDLWRYRYYLINSHINPFSSLIIYPSDKISSHLGLKAKDPRLGTNDILEDKIQEVLGETNIKLEGYTEEGVLLVTIEDILDPEEIDFLHSIDHIIYYNIKRFYIIEKLSQMVSRIW